MTDEQLDKIVAWFRSEFERRTKEVEANASNKIEWLLPEYRVSRTEVFAYAESIGIKMTAQDGIQLFHYLNRKD